MCDNLYSGHGHGEEECYQRQGEERLCAAVCSLTTSGHRRHRRSKGRKRDRDRDRVLMITDNWGFVFEANKDATLQDKVCVCVFERRNPSWRGTDGDIPEVVTKHRTVTISTFHIMSSRHSRVLLWDCVICATITFYNDILCIIHKNQ